MNVLAVRRWGVDFGNVIVQNLAKSAREDLMKQFAPCPEKFEDAAWCAMLDKFLLQHARLVDLAILGLKTLIAKVGQHNVWIVSRANSVERQINMRLLRILKIHEETHCVPWHVLFCNEREEKRDICETLWIDGHIDDRGEVLFYLQDVVPVRIWFAPSSTEYAQWYTKLDPSVRHVQGWQEIIGMMKQK